MGSFLSIELTSTPTSLSSPTTVTYSYKIKNNSFFAQPIAITNISVTDTLGNTIICPKTSLDPDEEMICTADYDFTQTEFNAGGSLDNTATVFNNGDSGMSTLLFSIPIVSGNTTCFLADTIVSTSNGEKKIQNITNKDKINNIQVHSLVTSMVPKNKKMFVLISKDAIGPNIPNKNTVCTNKHKILSNGKMIEAQFLVNNKTITRFSKPDDTLVYNILLVDNVWGIMHINNLVTETLHPTNKLAKYHYNKKDILELSNNNIM